MSKLRRQNTRPTLPPEFGSPDLPYLDAWSLPRGQHGHAPDTISASQRARLLYAVFHCVAIKGYNATTVADIVEIAEVSRSTFYGQFKDKEDCFIAAYEATHFALVAAVLASQKAGATWAERLRDTVRAYLQYCQDKPQMLRAILVQIHAAGVRAWEMRESAHERFARMQKALYELRREELPGLPELPHEVFRATVAAVEEMVNVYERRGSSGRIMELEPQVIYLLDSVYGGADHKT